MAITDETLMAYADGELTPAEMAELERAIAADEALAARAAVFAGTRTAVKRAFSGEAHMKVPGDLAERVRQLAQADAMSRQAATPRENVVDLASRRRPVPLWQLPAAAAIVLAIGAAGGWLAGRSGAAQGGALQVAGLNDPAIAEALSGVPSGESATLGEAEFRAIASFRDGEGQLCREFEHDGAGGQTVVAVACHSGGAWDVRFAVAAASADAAGYAPASSLDTPDAYLTASEAGSPLSPEDEAAALSGLR